MQIPLADQELLSNMADNLMASNVLKPLHSPGNSPIFVVRNPGGTSWRAVQEFCKCNERSHLDQGEG